MGGSQGRGGLRGYPRNSRQMATSPRYPFCPFLALVRHHTGSLLLCRCVGLPCDTPSGLQVTRRIERTRALVAAAAISSPSLRSASERQLWDADLMFIWFRLDERPLLFLVRLILGRGLRHSL